MCVLNVILLAPQTTSVVLSDQNIASGGQKGQNATLPVRGERNEAFILPDHAVGSEFMDIRWPGWRQNLKVER